MHVFKRLVCFVIAAIVLTFASGCTAKMKQARLLSRADGYYAAKSYDKAEIEYLNVLQLGPENAQAITKLGFIYFEQGRLGRVYPFLSKAKQLSPNDLDVRLKLAMLLASVGSRKEAHTEALYVLEHRVTDPEAPILLAETVSNQVDLEETKARLSAMRPTPAILTGLGTVEAVKRNYQEALALFTKAIALDSKFAAAHGAMGATYAVQNDLARAETSFATAATLSPVRSSRRLQIARFHYQTKKPDIALKELGEMLQQAPDYLPALLLTAEIETSQEKYDDSLAAINKVLARDDHHPEALLMLGRVYLAKGEADKAITALERGVSIHPQSALFHHQLGLAYMAKGELGKATASLSQAVALVPSYIPANLALADVNLRQKNAPAAVTVLRQLLQKQPGVIPAQYLLALALRAQNKLDDALVIYRGLAQASPRSSEPLLLIGGVLIEQKKKEEARKVFERALEVEPNSIPALEMLVALDLTAKNTAAAHKRADAFIARRPTDAGAYIVLAKIFLAENNNQQAEATLLKAIKLKPDDASAYFILARLYLSSKDFDKAIVNLKQAAAADPKDVEALMTLAMVEHQQKDYSAARDNYEKVLQVNPRFGAALNNLAYLYSEKLNDLDKAFDTAQRARELLPNDPNTADTLGWVLYKRSQYPWALSLLLESAEKMSTSADVQFHLGMTHYMLGDEQAAHLALERALQLDENLTEANDAKKALAMLNLEPADISAEIAASLEKKSTDPVALTLLGAYYDRAGNAAKAALNYTAALKTSPNNVRAAVGMIRVLQQQNELSKALELAKATRKIAPADPELSQVMGELAYQTGDHKWSMSLLQEIVKEPTADANAEYAFARAAYAVGQVSDAEASLRRAVEKGLKAPRLQDARNFLAMIELAGNPVKSDQPKAEQLLKADANYVPALIALAAIQEANGAAKPAQDTYERALQQFPDFSPAKKRLVILYAEFPPAKLETAVALASKARASYPQDIDVTKACGVIAYRKGDYTQAGSLLRECSNQRPTDMEAVYYLGMTQYRLNKKVESKQLLQKFLGSNPRPEWASEARQVLASMQ